MWVLPSLTDTMTFKVDDGSAGTVANVKCRNSFFFTKRQLKFLFSSMLLIFKGSYVWKHRRKGGKKKNIDIGGLILKKLDCYTTIFSSVIIIIKQNQVVSLHKNTIITWKILVRERDERKRQLCRSIKGPLWNFFPASFCSPETNFHYNIA